MTRADVTVEILPASARASFAASRRAIAQWDRAHPVDLAAMLDWVDQLRALFGDPPVDRQPWRGDDLRL